MRNLLFLLVLMVCACCETNEGYLVCSGIEDNDQAPAWFVEVKNGLTNCSCELSIIRATYHHQTVFYIGMTDPLCNSVNTPTLVDCNGEFVREFTLSADDQNDFYENVHDKEVLYRCTD